MVIDSMHSACYNSLNFISSGQGELHAQQQFPTGGIAREPKG